MGDQMTVSKWGNSLAVRIPLRVAKEVGISEGDSLELNVQGDGSLLLRTSKPRYSLDELVGAITPKNRHEEISWGDPVGKESW